MGRRGGALLGVALLLGLLALVAIGSVVWFTCGLAGCVDVERLRGYMPEEASTVVDRNGATIARLYLVRRKLVPLDSVPDFIADAFVAVEDRRFWEHGGVDWQRIPGAAWRNLRARQVQEGFSTITMQLARNLFPAELPAQSRTVWRKVGEMRAARQIEAHYGKREILELYLNQIYFGGGAWGIDAAAQEFFGKPASQLDLGEGSMLAGLPAAPSVLNPRADPAAALARRQVVLRRMVSAGFITEAQASAAAREPLRLSRGEWAVEEQAPYFVEAVRQQMEIALGSALYTQGLTIHTTLDPKIQTVAERELERQLERIESGAYGTYRHPRYDPDAPPGDGATAYVQGAVLLMDLQTGDVLALVGGRDFAASKYNRALQARRQPGSSFKPFVYAAALAAGYPPTTRLSDTPYQLRLSGGQVWAPTNYGGGYSGQVTMRDALRLSKNVPTVRLSDQVGLNNVLQMARRLGLQSQLPAVPSVVLGAAEVTPIDLLAAYTPFATLGRRVEPRFVVRVEDRNGQIRWTPPAGSRLVLDPATAFLVTDLLRDAVNRGTGTAVRAFGFNGPAAGKTGTTNDATDVWFVGYTPSAAAVVWIGFDRRQTIVRGATGGALAAPVWARIMASLPPPPADWAPPSGVETHRVDNAGYVVPADCPPMGFTRTEYFLRGTAQISSCQEYFYRRRDNLAPDGSRLLGEEQWWRLMRDSLLGNPADTLDGARGGQARPPLDSSPSTGLPREPFPDRWQDPSAAPLPPPRPRPVPPGMPTEEPPSSNPAPGVPAPLPIPMPGGSEPAAPSPPLLGVPVDSIRRRRRRLPPRLRRR